MSYVPTHETTQAYLVNDTMVYTDYVKGTTSYAEAQTADDGGASLEALQDMYKFSLEVSVGAGVGVEVEVGAGLEVRSGVRNTEVRAGVGSALQVLIARGQSWDRMELEHAYDPYVHLPLNVRFCNTCKGYHDHG